ncbi:MAG: phenylacetate--CoA ligase family protein [Bacteroidales bacterium]
MKQLIPEIEFASQTEITALQNKLLQETLCYVQSKSPFYQHLFTENNVDINAIKTIEDLHQIPIIGKSELQQYNNDFLCIPKSQIIDYTTTSGTSGKPVAIALSEADVERLTYNEAISFAGTVKENEDSSKDIYQLMVTLDKRFMAGMAYWLGIRRLGAGSVRVGGGAPQLQWDTIQSIKPNVIVCVPSFILKLIEYAEKKGIDYKNSSIKKAICIGESLRNQDWSHSKLAERIKSKWDIELYSTYASTEMGTSFTECPARKGGHHHPELIIAEIVDEKGNIVPKGKYGELVITTLGVEAMPLVRFNTGDIARFHYEKCQCGRTSMRISPILGRMNQMIKLKGTTVYPPAIFDVLAQFTSISAHYVEVSSNDYGTDEVKVHIAIAQNSEKIIKELQDSFRSRLRVRPTIVIDSLENILKVHDIENSRKPIRFVDKREQI